MTAFLPWAESFGTVNTITTRVNTPFPLCIGFHQRVSKGDYQHGVEILQPKASKLWEHEEFLLPCYFYVISVIE